MTSHSELKDVHDTLLVVQEKLQELVISRSSTSVPLWKKIEEQLSKQLNTAAWKDAEIRNELYKRGMSRVRREAGVDDALPDDEKQPNYPVPSRPELTFEQQRALDFIRESGPVLGRVVAEYLGIQERSFLRHYLKALRAHGLRNNRDGKGYFVEEP